MMRKPKLSTLVTALAAAALVLPAALVAQPAPAEAPDGFRGRGGPGGPWGEHREGPGPFMLERMADELDLSEAQLEEIEGMITTHRETTEDLRTEAHAAHEAIRELTEADLFDEAAIRAAGQRAADAQIELAVERARLRAELHTVLTPEQQEKAAELRQRRESRRELLRERRDGRGKDRPGRAPRDRRR